MKRIYNNKIFIFILLTIFVFIGNYSFFVYDYIMDDAWVIGMNYIHESIFSKDGIRVIWENILFNYNQQWSEQQRFIGFLPFFRIFEVWLSSNTVFHIILNLFFHILNAFLGYFFLINYFKINKFRAVLVILLFAVALNINSGSFALSIWIGSHYVNILTLFLLLYFSFNKIDNNPKYFYFIYFIYFIIAFGDYSLAVIIPPLFIIFLMLKKDFSNIKILLLLFLPILINLIIRSFAPISKYIGTIPNFDITHIFNNIISLTSILLGGTIIYQIMFVLFIVLSTSYGLYKKRVYISHFLISLMLIFGYIFLYSLSSRDNFGSTYFLYIPYFGLILLLVLSIIAINLNKILSIILVIFIGLIQYNDSIYYRDVRINLSLEIDKLRKHFKDIEQITYSDEKKLIIIIYDKLIYNNKQMGYFDKTINTWRDKKNNSCYIITDDYIKVDDYIKFRVGMNQYSDSYISWNSIDELLKQCKIKSNNYKILKIGNKIESIDKINLKDKRFILNNTYAKEQYLNGKSFYWTSGDLNLTAYFSKKENGIKHYISFNITSLFDNTIKIKTNNFQKNIFLKKNIPYLYKMNFISDSLQKEFKITSKKTISPPNDSRNLSFRIDNNIKIDKVSFIKKDYLVDLDFLNVSTKGFHSIEQNNFRWTEGNSTILLNKLIPKERNIKIILYASLVNNNIPKILLNNKIIKYKVDKLSNNRIVYSFKNIKKDIDSINFMVEIFDPENGDKRELGFMYHGLKIEIKDK